MTANGSKNRPRRRSHTPKHQNMTFIEANPERVRSYFQDPRVKYAA